MKTAKPKNGLGITKSPIERKRKYSSSTAKRWHTFGDKLQNVEKAKSSAKKKSKNDEYGKSLELSMKEERKIQKH